MMHQSLISSASAIPHALKSSSAMLRPSAPLLLSLIKKRSFSSGTCCGGAGCGRSLSKSGGCCGGSGSCGLAQRPLFQVRSFSKAAAPPSRQSSSTLAKKLESEMKMELEEHEFADHIADASMPAELSQMLGQTGFRVEYSKPGSSLVSLVKDLGNEVVKVEFDVEQIYQNGQESGITAEGEEEMGMNEDEDSSATSYQLEVEIVRKDTGEALRADCWLHDEFCELNYLKFVPKAADSDVKGAFMGPSIADLDEEVAEALSDWVASKGVNEDLYQFISAYALFKESCEYYKWCGDVKRFVSK